MSRGVTNSFANHRKEHIKKAASEDLQSNPYLDASQKNLIALNTLLSSAAKKISNIPSEKKDLYSHMVAFYSMMNETFAQLKKANNDQKREDKAGVEQNQKNKEFYAWTRCVQGFSVAIFQGAIGITNDEGRFIAETAIGNIERASGNVIDQKTQREEHRAKIGGDKQAAAQDRNRSIGDNDRTVRQSLAEAMRNYQRAFGEGRVNN